MNALITEFQRLFFLPGQEAVLADQLPANMREQGGQSLPLVSPEHQVRTMVLEVARTTDWDDVSTLYHGVQDELNLPAPAISVCPGSGFQVWFSLSEPVSLVKAVSFLEALRTKYLPNIPAGKVALHPRRGSGKVEVLSVPSWHDASGRWSAFIDPTLGGMFADEPGLEMAPNLDRQAAMLAGLKSIKPTVFERLLERFPKEPESEDALHRTTACSEHHQASKSSPAAESAVTTLNVGAGFTDPKTFLLAVMNDQGASAMDRIQAAQVLLPYFETVKRDC